MSGANQNPHQNVRWHKADGQQKTLEKEIMRESSCLFSFFGGSMADNKIREQIVKAAYQYSLLANKIYMYVCGEQYCELLFAVVRKLSAYNQYDKERSCDNGRSR